MRAFLNWDALFSFSEKNHKGEEKTMLKKKFGVVTLVCLLCLCVAMLFTACGGTQGEKGDKGESGAE